MRVKRGEELKKPKTISLDHRDIVGDGMRDISNDKGKEGGNVGGGSLGDWEEEGGGGGEGVRRGGKRGGGVREYLHKNSMIFKKEERTEV